MEGKATFTLTDAATGKTVKQFTEHVWTEWSS